MKEKSAKGMSVEEAIRFRKSVRSYKPDLIPDDIIERIIEGARLAPSAGNRQPWRFMVIREDKQRKDLMTLAYNQPFVGQAPVVIACLSDLSSYSMDARRRQVQELKDAGAGEIGDVEEYIRSYPGEGTIMPGDDSEKAREPAAFNCAIAITHLILMAASFGLGTCWVQKMKTEEIRDYLRLPSKYIVVALVTIGFPAVGEKKRVPKLDLSEIILR